MNDENWSNVLNKLFVDKKNLQRDFVLSSKITNHNEIEKSVVIKIEKNYLSRVLVSRINELKKELETELNDYIFKININGKDFEFNSTSINEKIVHIKKEDIENTPISYKTTEKAISGSSNLKIIDDLNYKNRRTELFFYNKLLYSTKKITINYKILYNEKSIKYALYFIWTIVIPIFLFGKVINNKIKYYKIKKEIIKLINLKYIPLNQETKKFVELYI